MISYGADHAEKLLVSDALLNQYPFLADSYAFTVCRIEPENNIHIILAALEKFGQLNMVVVGNWRIVIMDGS